MNFIKKYKIYIYIFIIILVAGIIIFKIYDYQRPKSIEINRKQVVDEEVPTKNNLPTIDFESIRKKYSKDIKGALRISDEKFEEIVFQGDDNEYYLNHNYRNKKGNGEIFIDCNLDIDSSKIKVLYAQGSSKMKIFENYYDSEYYKAHKYLELETDKEVYKYEVVALIEDEVNYKEFDSEELVKKAKYIYNVDFTNEDEFLIVKFSKNDKIVSILSRKVK